jgi:hypothetical protein
MSELEKSEWCWSFDGEHFNHGPEHTKEAALSAARLEEPHKAVWIGRKIEWIPFSGPLSIVETLLEQEGCEANDSCGEAADDWCMVSTLSGDKVLEAGHKIQAIMRELVGTPHFWSIVDIEDFAPEVIA